MRRTLVVSAEHAHQILELLGGGASDFLTAPDCQTARRLLGSRPLVEALLVDLELPDGNWCSLLDSVRQAAVPTPLFVYSERNGQIIFWEAVQRGGEFALVPSGPAFLRDSIDSV